MAVPAPLVLVPLAGRTLIWSGVRTGTVIVVAVGGRTVTSGLGDATLCTAREYGSPPPVRRRMMPRATAPASTPPPRSAAPPAERLKEPSVAAWRAAMSARLVG